MATLTDNPSFSANEIYEIQATDPVEGAATGASFGGIGLDNQPHQQLANRTAKLNQQQVINVANINQLLGFIAVFSFNLQQNGYIKLEGTDIHRGLIQAIVQWGWFPLGSGRNGDKPFTVAWPLAFPNACFAAFPVIAFTQGTTPDLGIGVQADANGNPLVTRTGGTFYVNRYNVDGNAPGFYWLAIGF